MRGRDEQRADQASVEPKLLHGLTHARVIGMAVVVSTGRQA